MNDLERKLEKQILIASQRKEKCELLEKHIKDLDRMNRLLLVMSMLLIISLVIIFTFINIYI
jgi:hypothetical protein